jgi:hypothetical protein
MAGQIPQVEIQPGRRLRAVRVALSDGRLRAGRLEKMDGATHAGTATRIC